MFEYLKGTIETITPTAIVIDVQGVGYLVHAANPYRFKIGNEIVVYVYQDVHQDSILLFGFRTYEEKQLFKKLINVSGIGPKSGLAILANEDHYGLIQAIEEENVKFLMKFPGVGKKTAAQMVLDLKGKLGELALSVGMEDTTYFQSLERGNQELEEALEALSALGYNLKEIKRVRKILEQKSYESTDEYIRNALTLLMKK
ncbi:Holliday junction branch migration protein RuvA [Lacticigenium naphthae]|uniref:Holliday junction branch migration protein RuvA n=1 Tax=Lacticigenium naphthae TaxID=515351 RepID=UPI000426ADB9|nr:Holliday junction branch migration protein RuvA [Lacticigenium naphthae]